MDIKKTINDEFNRYVNETFKKEWIKSFLKNHERKHIMVDNLKKQIDESSHVLLPSSRPTEEKRAIIKTLARDFAHQFCKVAIEVKEGELVNSHTRIGEVDGSKEEDGKTIITD